MPSLPVFKELKKNGYFLHDIFDPEQEAIDLLNKIEHKHSNAFNFIYGLGLGYVLKRFNKKLEGYIIVYEPDIDVLRLTLEMVDFSDEVMDDFIAQIQNDIDDKIPYIIADATHLTIKSRCQVLERLRLTGVLVNYVCFEVPLDVAIQRNNLRQGRELVPETVIVNMFNRYVRPKGFVIVVDKEGKETVI